METGKIAQKKPFVVDEQPGKRLWCRCGLSASQPFCDGSHKATQLRPLAVEVKEARIVFYCGCKQTKNPPFCDGTHRTLP